MSRSGWGGALLVAALLVAGCQSSARDDLAAPTTIPATSRPDPAPTATPLTSPAARSTPMPAPRAAYLALGDSVTFGIGVVDPQDQGYPARLAERLGAAGSAIDEVRVVAVPGETARGFLDRHMDRVERAIDGLGDRVALVTIGLGANDLLRTRRDPACVGEPGGTACQDVALRAGIAAQAALDAVVGRVTDALAAAGSDAIVLLLAYYNPNVEPIAAATVVGADGRVGCVSGDPAPGLNDRIACVAERHDVGLVDLHAAFLGRETELTGISVGDVHPNAAGYDVIAAEIADVIGLPEQPD